MTGKAQLSQDRKLRADVAFPCQRDTVLLDTLFPGFQKSVEDKARDFQRIVINSESCDAVFTKLKQTCGSIIIESLSNVRFTEDRKTLTDGTDALGLLDMC